MTTQCIASARVPAFQATVPQSGRRDGTLRQTISYAAGQRRPVTVRYSLWGPPGAPVVIALGGISATRRCDRWWPAVFGNGLDPVRWRILGMDWLGRFWPDGSAVTTIQQATALASVLDRLGLTTVHGLIGASYGAMIGLAFAARFPERLERLLAISGAHRTHPMAVARRLIQRRIVDLGIAAGRAAEGLELARALALTTYRPDRLFAEQFGHDDPGQVLESLAGYFRRQGQRFQAGFSAARYRCLSESLDRHRVDPAAVRCSVDLVAADSDALVPPEQLRALANQLGPRARYHEIHSRFGHDAFLKEDRTINALIEHTLGGDRR
ncbi:MAG: homoserine O-succinyltransferase [Pseudomonadota bacterium]|nr:MAG: homoserine O-succinyltransferase [Pseudomonadota bacterium]